MVEISSRKSSKASPSGSGTGSMSSYYLQKLINVTQDRSGQKDDQTSVRPRKPLKTNPFGSLSMRVHETNQEPQARFRDKEAAIKNNSLLKEEVIIAPSSPTIQKGQNTHITPTKHQNFDIEDKFIRKGNYFEGFQDRPKKSGEGKESAFKGTSKSYYLPGSSPYSDKDIGSLNNSSSKDGDYSGIESKAKTKEFDGSTEDKGMIDKFSKWIKRIGPKY
jgi:hypothetical protein